MNLPAPVAYMAKKITSKTGAPKFLAYARQSNVSPTVYDAKYSTDPYVWYGRNNLFPEYIRSLADNCGPLERCMTTLAQFIAGHGIKFLDKSGNELEAAQAKFQALLVETTEEDFLHSLAYDIAHGLGVTMTVRRSATGDIVRLDHLDVLGYRSGHLENGKVTTAYWSSDWAMHMANKTDPRYQPVAMPIHEFGPDGKRYPLSVIYDKHYKPRQPYYGVPWFLGAIPASEVWAKVDVYNATQIDTGFTPKVAIGTRFEGTESDMQRHMQNVQDAYTGSQGDSLFQFTLGPGEDEPFFHEFGKTNGAGELDEIRNGVADVICEVYGTPPILFRERTGGLTSQRDAINMRIQQFQRTVVQPMQKLITRNIVKILDMPEIWEAKIEPLEVFDEPQTEAIIMASMTVNEAREERGDDPLEGPDGDMLLGLVKAPVAPPNAPVDPNADPNAPVDPKQKGVKQKPAVP